MSFPRIQAGVEHIARDEQTFMELTTAGCKRLRPALPQVPDPDRERTSVAEDRTLHWSGFYRLWRERVVNDG